MVFKRGRKTEPEPKKPAPKAAAKPAHRAIDDIKRDISNAPAQGLPVLQAELVAALEAERSA